MAVILGFEAQLGASWEQIHRLLLQPMVTLRCSTTLGMIVSLRDSKDLAKFSKMCIERNIEFCLFVCCAVLLVIQCLFLFLISPELCWGATVCPVHCKTSVFLSAECLC